MNDPIRGWPPHGGRKKIKPNQHDMTDEYFISVMEAFNIYEKSPELVDKVLQNIKKDDCFDDAKILVVGERDYEETTGAQGATREKKGEKRAKISSQRKFALGCQRKLKREEKPFFIR